MHESMHELDGIRGLVHPMQICRAPPGRYYPYRITDVGRVALRDDVARHNRLVPCNQPGGTPQLGRSFLNVLDTDFRCVDMHPDRGVS